MHDSAGESGLRQRKKGRNVQEVDNDSSARRQEEDKRGVKQEMKSGSYWLTRVVFVRSLGFVYCKWLHE